MGVAKVVSFIPRTTKTIAEILGFSANQKIAAADFYVEPVVVLRESKAVQFESYG